IQFHSGISLTGTSAVARLVMKPPEGGAGLFSLYNESTVQSLAGCRTKKQAQKAITSAAVDLSNARGSSVVVVGANDIHIQSLANAINTALGAYGAIIDLDNYSKQYQGLDSSFQEFLTAANAGQVGVAFFLNSNPAYDYF